MGKNQRDCKGKIIKAYSPTCGAARSTALTSSRLKVTLLPADDRRPLGEDKIEGIFSSTVLVGLIGCDDDVEGLESRSVTGANGDSIELRSIRIVGSTCARTSF